MIISDSTEQLDKSIGHNYCQENQTRLLTKIYQLPWSFLPNLLFVCFSYYDKCILVSPFKYFVEQNTNQVDG